MNDMRYICLKYVGLNVYTNKFTWSTIENLKSKEYSLVQNEDELSQECDP